VKLAKQELRSARNDLETPRESGCSVQKRAREFSKRVKINVIEAQSDIISDDLFAASKG